MIAAIRRMLNGGVAEPAAPLISDTQAVRERLAAEHDARFASLRASRSERQDRREREIASNRLESRRRDPLLQGGSR